MTDQGLIAAGSLQVGVESCAVAVAPDGKHPRGLRQGILAETAAWTHILCSTPGAAFNSLA